MRHLVEIIPVINWKEKSPKENASEYRSSDNSASPRWNNLFPSLLNKHRILVYKVHFKYIVVVFSLDFDRVIYLVLNSFPPTFFSFFARIAAQTLYKFASAAKGYMEQCPN